MDEAAKIAEMIGNFEFDEILKLTDSSKVGDLYSHKLNTKLKHHQSVKFENRCF